MLARGIAVLLIVSTVAGLGASNVYANVSDSTAAAALRARYGALQNQLRLNQFQKPIYLDSRESAESVAGDIYALIKHPFTATSAALNGPARWCEIMMLHVNTKFCRAITDGRAAALQVHIGKKHDQPVDEAQRVDFDYRVIADTPEYLKVTLIAEAGPFSTRDYRVILEAIPLDSGATIMHFTYSYGYGFAGRLAMQTYLSTIGSRKVGFTVVGKQADGGSQYIGGMRGLVERNTMRYYLAIEAFLGALSTPPQAQLEKRLHDWFAAVERYPRQLHELELREYLEMKRREFRRQQADRSAG